MNESQIETMEQVRGESYLKEGVTFKELDDIAGSISDNEAAKKLNQARDKLFQVIFERGLILTPLELLDRLAHLVTPPRIHKHRYCGVLAPNAKLRRAVIESAGPAGATLQLLEDAREQMGLAGEEATDDKPQSAARQAAARCWALLLVRHRRRRDRAAIPSTNAWRCCTPGAASPCGSSRLCWIRR